MSISLKSINVGHWNINGFKSKLLGNKTENKDFLSCIKKCDIIGLTETHSSKEGILDIPGFSDPFSVSRPKSKNNKNSGGIAVYVRTYLIDSKAVCQVNTHNKNSVWLKLRKDKFDEPEDIFIGTFYLSPESYEKQMKSNYMDDLEKEVFRFSCKGKVIIQGDFNARCANLQDTVEPSNIFDQNNNITDLQTSSLHNIPPRNSADLASNHRGQRLIDICIMCNAHIVNGRKTGHTLGKMTCFRWNGSSLIDLVICYPELFISINYLYVGEFLLWLSDHCPLFFCLNLNKVEKINENQKLKNAPGKFIWNSEAKQNFRKTLESNEISLLLDKLVLDFKTSSVNKSVKDLTNFLVKTCEKSNIKKVGSRGKNKTTLDKPWFEKDCKEVKNELKLLGKDIIQNPQNDDLRKKLCYDKKVYKKLTKQKSREYT